MKEQTKYQVKTKLIKGDEVTVIAGGSRGSSGKIEKIDRKKSRVFITGVNVKKKHRKPSGEQPGEIVDKVMPIHISNVQLLDPSENKPTRIGYRIEGEAKVRVAKASNTVITAVQAK